MYKNNLKILGTVFIFVGSIPIVIGIFIGISYKNIAPVAVVSGIGLVFAILGLSFVIADHHKSKKITRIKSEGTVLEATINDIVLHYGMKINNRHPYTVHAQYEDIYGGNKYDFKSEYLIRKPAKNIGDTVNIYVMRNDYSIYYIDTSNLY